MRYVYKMLNTGIELISFNRFDNEQKFIESMNKQHGFKKDKHYKILGTQSW